LIRSDEGAPDPGWCSAHGAVRRAAWSFCRARASTRRCSARPVMPRPRSPTPRPDAWLELAARGAGSSCGPASSCVVKSTRVPGGGGCPPDEGILGTEN
jgi:hypothetical protein